MIETRTETAGMTERAIAVIALFLSTGALLPLIRQQSVSDAGIAAGDPLQQAIWSGVYGIVAVLLLARHLRRALFVCTRQAGLLILILLPFLSITWSDAPGVTARKAVAVAGTSLLGLWLSTRFTVREQLRLLCWALGLAVTLSILTAVLLPVFGVMDGLHEGAWRGVFVHKNLTGRIAALAAASFAVLASVAGRGRWVCRGMIAVSIVLVLASRSASAMLMTGTLLLMIPLFRVMRSSGRLMMPVILVALIAAAIAGTLLVEQSETVLNALGKDSTLTGRTELWDSVVDKIEHRPLLGYGFGAFWLGLDGDSAFVWFETRWDPTHAHNGILDLMLDAGLAGTLLYALIFIGTARRALEWLRRQESAIGSWPLIYLAFVLVTNLSESAVLRPNSLFWILFVSLSFSLASETGTAESRSRNWSPEPGWRPHSVTEAVA